LINRRASSPSDEVLRRLIRAPETANQIYELAESLYMRCGGAGWAGRMSLADIERIGEYLRQAERDDEAIKKQLYDLTRVQSDYTSEEIPVGF
jgi:hypothetical protein